MASGASRSDTFRWIVRRPWLALVVCGWGAAAVLAEPKSAPQPEDVLPLSELDDPIGVDSDSRTLQEIADRPRTGNEPSQTDEARARFGPEPPALLVRNGEVLTAAPSTRERTHEVRIELEPATARVELRMSFENLSKKPSELRYRLALPSGGRLTSLEVCNALGCRQGTTGERAAADRDYDAALLARGRGGGALPLPIARARRVRDNQADAVIIHAAPVVDGQPLRVRIGYVAPAQLHAGVVRFVLPARGMDPQLAPAEVKLSLGSLVEARMDNQPNSGDAVRVDPWLELPVQAMLRGAEPLHVEVQLQRCAGRHCGWAALWAGPKPPKPVDLVIALDVSPSTEGPARGRLLAAIAALLAAAPDGSRVRALAFAGRAAPLIEVPAQPGQVALAPFARAIAEAELGSATRVEAVFKLARSWLLKNSRRDLRPLIAIVGDGGLTRGVARPFELARSTGIEVDAVNVSDRATLDALTSGVGRAGGVALELGSEAEAAARGRDPRPLEERLAALFAPAIAARVRVQGTDRPRVELGALRAGEAMTWRGTVRGAFSLAYDRIATGDRVTATSRSPGPGLAGAGWEDVLVAIDPHDLDLAPREDWPPPTAKGRCDRRGPARRRSGISSDAQPVALAEERACGARSPVAQAGSDVGVGMPSAPLLAMLRQRILPVARGCFRTDRAGRAQYQHRAVFVFSLADREVASAQVEGAIPDALRGCLLAAVDQLEVPRFSGVVNVRYPLITESLPLPEQIELKAETSGTLDRLFGDPPTPGQHSLDAPDSALHTPPASSVERVHD